MEVRKEYQERGYYKVDALLGFEVIEDLLSALQSLISRVAIAIGIEFTDDSRENVFNHLISSVYLAQPDAGSFIYDTFNRLLSAHKIFDDTDLLDITNTLLGAETTNSLAITERQFFIMIPDDHKQLLGWHQDSGYFSEYSSRSNSLFCWIPLFDCSIDDGALWAIPGSHHNGAIPHSSNELGTHKEQLLDKRGYRYLDDEFVSTQEAEQIPMKQGDVLFIDFNTIHKSGHTTTDRVRYTALARFSNIYSPGYIAKYGIW